MLPIAVPNFLTKATSCRIIYVRMSSTISEIKIENLAQLDSMPQVQQIDAISAGLPAHLARELAKCLNVTMEDMAGLLRLNPRTFQRRLDEGTLDFSESERLWELSRLFHRGVGVLETRAGAVHWFKNSVEVFGWANPFAYACTAGRFRGLDNSPG